jgi:hypothetical protein
MAQLTLLTASEGQPPRLTDSFTLWPDAGFLAFGNDARTPFRRLEQATGSDAPARQRTLLRPLGRSFLHSNDGHHAPTV